MSCGCGYLTHLNLLCSSKNCCIWEGEDSVEMAVGLFFSNVMNEMVQKLRRGYAFSAELSACPIAKS